MKLATQGTQDVYHCQGRIQGGGGIRRAPPPKKIGKNMIFCVRSWFSTSNTPKIFARLFQVRSLNLKSCIRPWLCCLFFFDIRILTSSIGDLLYWLNSPSLPITFPCFESCGVYIFLAIGLSVRRFQPTYWFIVNMFLSWLSLKNCSLDVKHQSSNHSWYLQTLKL